jgi:hypothetical protein
MITQDEFVEIEWVWTGNQLSGQFNTIQRRYFIYFWVSEPLSPTFSPTHFTAVLDVTCLSFFSLFSSSSLSLTRSNDQYCTQPNQINITSYLYDAKHTQTNTSYLPRPGLILLHQLCRLHKLTTAVAVVVAAADLLHAVP